MKKGIVGIAVIVVLTLVIGVGATLGYQKLIAGKKQKTIFQQSSEVQVNDQKTSNKSSAQENEKFLETDVIKFVTFVNSKGIEQKLIVVDAGEKDAIRQAEIYITDNSLSKTSAIKVVIPSQSSLGIGTLTLSKSPGSGQIFIALSVSVGDGASTSVIREDGVILTKEVTQNAWEKVKEKCQCGFQLGDWKNNYQFFVNIPTPYDTYQLLIDAQTGKVISEPVKI